MRIILGLIALHAIHQLLPAAEPIPVWPDLAPGESTRHTGELQPFRKNEVPPVSRVVKITLPTMTVHQPTNANGTAVVLLPGGGFAKVVPDKEGTEAADWLAARGITSFVLSYRTKNNPDELGWRKPLQDAQRTLSLVRARAARWKLRPDQIGLLGFSAGGQVAARLLCGGEQRVYEPLDDIDQTPFRPDFALLVYPWNCYDSKTDQLVDGLTVPRNCPPTFLVHTDDDRSSSLGAVLIYASLKKHGIPAALHVYGNGGHGYGLRPVQGSRISTWPDAAGNWLVTRGVARPTK